MVEFSRTQRRLLRELRDGAELIATLNEGYDFARGYAMFARGEIWTQKSGSCINLYASKTIEAVYPKYVNQENEESGNVRHMSLNDAGKALFV